MKILVSLKRTADPDNANKIKVAPGGAKIVTDGLENKLNPFDEYAVETALRLVENGKVRIAGDTVSVVSLGPKETTGNIRQALAMGADTGALFLTDDESLDGDLVARALAKVVEQQKPDLVILGKQAVDGDSNQVAQGLAELLGWPSATFAMSINLAADKKTVTVGREARRLDAVAPRAVYQIDQAVSFVAERLPDETQARLTLGELESLMVSHINWLHGKDSFPPT